MTVESTDAFSEWAAPALPGMTRAVQRLYPTLDPDDMIQEALLRGWHKHHLFDPERGSATSWLISIVLDLCRQAVRRPGRAPITVPIDHHSVRAGAYILDSENSDVSAVEDAIRDLSPRLRLATYSHYFVGLTIEETASVMGCTAGTVKSSLHDARQKIRNSLITKGSERNG